MPDKEQQLRNIIHDLANAFSRLNSAAEIFRDRPDVFTADKLEAERAAASEKFSRTMDTLPRR